MDHRTFYTTLLSYEEFSSIFCYSLEVVEGMGDWAEDELGEVELDRLLEPVPAVLQLVTNLNNLK